jgi:hypothetical protein
MRGVCRELDTRAEPNVVDSYALHWAWQLHTRRTMHLSTLISAHYGSLEEAFVAWRTTHGEPALLDLLGSVTAYLVAGQRVFAPAAGRVLDATTATEQAREQARIRILLLRLCAMKKLKSARLETAMTELQSNVALLSRLEAQKIAPELDRVLPLDVARSLAHRIGVEHEAAARAFRQIATRARAAETQRSEGVASAAA